VARKIIWSKEARDQYQEIVEYWNTRNNSTTYTNRIHHNLLKSLSLISKFPMLGKPTTLPPVRAKVFMENFTIFYETTSDDVMVLSFWDNRRDPDTNKFQ